MIRTLSAAFLAFLTLTGAALACPTHLDQQAMSCIEGTVWDPDSRTCVTPSTG